MNETNFFGQAFSTAGRAFELTKHFLDKEVEITLRDDRKITGILNFFSQELIIISGKHIINFRYVVNISIIG